MPINHNIVYTANFCSSVSLQILKNIVVLQFAYTAGSVKEKSRLNKSQF